MTKTKKPDLTGTVVMNLLFALPLRHPGNQPRGYWRTTRFRPSALAR